MQPLKTRREFLCDIGALSCVAVLNIDIIQATIPPSHTIGVLPMDLHDPEEGSINMCYLGVGKTGLKIGNMLSKHVGEVIQTTAIYRDGGSLFSCARNARFTMLERPLEKQGIVVLVSDINDPLFFDLRNYAIARSCCIWTICMVPETADKFFFDMHYAPNEILRIVRGPSFPYQDTGSFIQSILAIYKVQYSQRHDEDFANISTAAMEDLGL